MFTKEDTLIIIGKSPILNKPEVETAIQYVKTKFHTIGINQAAVIFNTEYFAFADYTMKIHFNEIHPNTKIITLDRLATEKFPCEYFTIYYAKDDDPPFKGDELAYRGFTHDICMSYACYKKFKNVILFGVADFTSEGKYLNKLKTCIDAKEHFSPSDIMKRNSIYFINNVCTKYLNVYTINPESILDVPRITIEDIMLDK